MPDPTSSGLLALPPEILHAICSLLYDTHMPSLKSFCLVASRCCTVSTAWLFRHVKLTVRGSQSLPRDLAQLWDILERRSAFDGVHRVTVSGGLHVFRDGEVEPPPPEWELDNYNWNAHDEIYGKARVAISYHPGPPATAEELASAWEPLISVIRKATHLRYFDYNCWNPVPLNVLDALEQLRPTCRLHVDSFQYRNLDNEMRVPNEIRLARSPVLHSIKTRYTDRDADGIDNYNREAMIRTIRGVIPNLRRVEMVHYYAPSSLELHRRMGEPRPSWKGFDAHIGPDRLAYLDRFTCNESLTLHKLTEWDNTISFRDIRHLELKQSASNFALHYFSSRIKFRQLDTLSLVLGRPHLNEAGLESGPPLTDPASFLNSLAPLRSLVVNGFLADETISAILIQHGSRLRDLKLSPDGSTYWRSGVFQKSCLSLDVFERLSDSCPYLEDLQIAVQRFKSRGEEVKCYQALSACKSLRKLFIELRCNKPNAMPHTNNLVPDGQTVPASDTDSDAEENDEGPYIQNMHPWDQSRTQPNPNIAHLKRAFQNCAMDETLALSIWKLIAGCKKGLPLQSLKLYTVGAANFTSGGGSDFQLEDRTRIMSRAYLLERSPRDDAPAVDNVQVQELGKRTREAHILQGRERDKPKVRMLRNHREVQIEKAFRCIWPERKAGSVDWRDDWYSMPLQIPD